ncbi:outer membrane protein assembly factor BamD [Rhodoplanes sp. SY1]|uniref:outer membrane protein assembly factor BamD n=1 Tax=Rhodoplanes sp. SY1 TaxID=3166646 RepID=UPI0038B47693
MLSTSTSRAAARPGRSAGGRAGLRRLIALLPVLVILGGCSSLSNLFGGNDDDLGPDLPADKLYNEGVYLLNEKNAPKDAVKKFEEVDRQHPYSEWARKSLLMTAYSYYETRQYDEAIGAAKRYVTMHPGSPDVAYAQYLIGASYYDQIPDVTRDQTRTEKAIQSLEEVIRKYPTSEYAAQARKKIEVGRDHLAAKEMEVARYYMQKKNFIGAINRFKVVVTQYQTTRHVEEALMRLTECYMMLGIASEAQTAAAVLGHNFPDSPWYKDAYNLVRGGGFEPSENKGSWISRAFKKVGLG